MTDPFTPPSGEQHPPPSDAPQPGATPYGAAPYGAPQYGAPQYGGPVALPARNGLGVAALVLGILSIFPLDLLFIPGILAVIFGIIGRRRARRGEATNGGMALAGLITGVIGLLIGVGLVIFLSFFGNEISDYQQCINDSDRSPAAQAICQDRLQHRIQN